MDKNFLLVFGVCMVIFFSAVAGGGATCIKSGGSVTGFFACKILNVTDVCMADGKLWSSTSSVSVNEMPYTDSNLVNFSRSFP